MYMHNFGDKPVTPYLVFGKQSKETTQQRYKKISKWRSTRETETFIDVSSSTERNFQEDILVPMLRLIVGDQSIRIEDLPTRYTKKKPDQSTTDK
jgi:hypothetical protein